MGINLREKEVSKMSYSELVYNDCYVKGRQAMYRNYDIDCSAREVIRSIYKDKQIHELPDFWLDDNYFDEVMYDNLQYGFENDLGILAILYQQLWSKAEMRETLRKMQEQDESKNGNKNQDKLKGNDMVKRYKTKPCEIEAIQWNGDNVNEVLEFITFKNAIILNEDLFINTLEGKMKANIGDYIIKGLRGEFYPCKPDVFEKKYEMI